jgi:glycosyltransferase involved in cell wall biosynthesis
VQLLYYSQLKSKKVATFGRFSDIVVGAPLSTSHYSRKKFVNIFAIGLPYCADQVDDHGVEQVDSEFSSRSNESVRILHSPSHPAAKGSASIEQAIAKLKRKGYSIDLIMLRNRPHAEVIREIQLCDFVVDQVYSDTPMAGFATEAAWYGKPAVVGGYGLRYLKEFVPEGMWPPSKICHPEDLVETIEELVRNRDERLKLGTAAMNFVRNNWSVSAVARRYHNLLNEAIPRGWWVEPHLVTYLEGAGQHEEQSRENIRRMVERFGVASLKMSHRSDMELAFLNFANAKQGG